MSDAHLVVYEPDHPTVASDLLLSAQRDKARIVAFARALGHATQLLEDALFGLITGATPFESATLDALQRWGGLIGEDLGGLSKAEYVQVIALRSRANSIGTTTTPDNATNFLTLLVDIFTPSSVLVTIETAVPLIRVVVLGDTELLSESLATRGGRLVRDARPIGTLVTVIEGYADTFRFDVGPGYDDGEWGRDLYDGRYARG